MVFVYATAWRTWRLQSPVPLALLIRLLSRCQYLHQSVRDSEGCPALPTAFEMKAARTEEVSHRIIFQLQMQVTNLQVDPQLQASLLLKSITITGIQVTKGYCTLDVLKSTSNETQ